MSIPTHCKTCEIRCDQACKAEQAYFRAREEGPSKQTRDLALAIPEYAYKYAAYVDRCGRDDTRKAVLPNAFMTYNYVMYIDEGIIYNNHNAAFYIHDFQNVALPIIRRKCTSKQPHNRLHLGFMPLSVIKIDVL